MNQDINIHKILGQYRLTLEKKHPEPKPGGGLDETGLAGKKPESKQGKKDAKGDKNKEAVNAEASAEIFSNLSEGEADDDSVICDEDDLNFT